MKNTYHVEDINSDGELDIILYEEHHVRVKYGKQKSSYGWGGYGQVVIWPFASMQELVEQVKPDHGWYAAGGSAFKLWDYEPVSYDFARQGHNLESMSWNWEQDPTVAAYVIEVSEKVDVHYDKKRWSAAKVDPNRTRYIIALPQSMSPEWLELELPDQLKKDALTDYLKDGTVVDVVYYDGKKPTIKALLKDVDKRWYYAKVAPLALIEQQKKQSISFRT